MYHVLSRIHYSSFMFGNGIVPIVVFAGSLSSFIVADNLLASFGGHLFRFLWLIVLLRIWEALLLASGFVKHLLVGNPFTLGFIEIVWVGNPFTLGFIKALLVGNPFPLGFIEALWVGDSCALGLSKTSW